jgi:hypothetical protein
MTPAELENFINKGFRIIRKYRNTIQTRTKRPGWSLVSPYSPERWEELLNHPKTLVYGQ